MMTEARPVTSPTDPPSAIVLSLSTAYQASRALYVAAKLGLPDLLADGPRSVDDLACSRKATTAASRSGRSAGACAPMLRARCARWC